MSGERETVRCIVCKAPSEGQIATGHVTTLDGHEIIATFCSRKCFDAAGPAGPKGRFGAYQRWMGTIPWRASAPDER